MNELAQTFEMGNHAVPDDPPSLAFVPEIGVVEQCLKFFPRAHGFVRHTGCLGSLFMKLWHQEQDAVPPLAQALGHTDEGLYVAPGPGGTDDDERLWRARDPVQCIRQEDSKVA